MDDNKIKQILHQFAQDAHLSIEVLEAYQSGIISSRGAYKISMHLKHCSLCSYALGLLKESINWESVEIQEQKQSIILPEAFHAKLALAVRMYGQQNKIIIQAACSGLPHTSEKEILRLVQIYQNWLMMDAQMSPAQTKDLSVAAFSGQSMERSKELSAVINAFNLSDSIIALVLEKCQDISDAKHQLPVLSMNIVSMWEDEKTADQVCQEVRKIIENALMEV